MAASQEGILYELLDANGVGILEGKAQPGNQRPLVLTSTPLTEDTRIRIKAYRRQPPEETLLTTELSVKVRPNPNVGVRSSSDDPVDYGAATIISLDTPQLSTAYQLYKWQLTPKHYQPGGQVSIPTPSQLPNWENLERVGDFVESAGQQSCTTGPIHEDTFFIVRATKIENGETLPLTTIVPVLAKPDTSPSVRAESPAVDANSSGRVIVTHTQASVHYQLRVNDGDALVNQPGYHHADRKIGTFRVGIDFQVAGVAETELWLPTSPLTTATAYNVLAIKTLSRVTAQLDQTVTIGIRPTPSAPSE